MQLRIYESEELSADRWDEFVRSSVGGSIYAEFGTLNALCPKWIVAIVEENGIWLSAMPLQVSYKFGLRYSFPPLFTQYLGVMYAEEPDGAISNTELRFQIQELFANFLKRHFRFLVAHAAPDSVDRAIWVRRGYTVDERVSYILALRKPMDELWETCSTNIRRNIRKGQKQAGYREENNAKELVQLFQAVKGSEIEGIAASQYERYEKWIQHLLLIGRAHVLTYRDGDASLRAGVILIRNGNQIIYSMGVQTEESRKQGLLSALLWIGIGKARDEGLEEFDFEGSMHPGIARFFAGFGAEPRTYFKISHKPFWYPRAL